MTEKKRAANLGLDTPTTRMQSEQDDDDESAGPTGFIAVVALGNHLKIKKNNKMTISVDFIESQKRYNQLKEKLTEIINSFS